MDRTMMEEDPQLLIMVAAVSVVSILMHCTDCTRTIRLMHAAWRICISIICGGHKYGLMELSEWATAY